MTKRFVFFVISMIIITLSINSGLAETAQLSQQSTNKSQGIWNLKDVDIRAFIRAVAEETGKNFAIDPRVTGKVTFISTQPLSQNELYQAFLSVLQVNGFVALPNGKITKIVPDFVAKGLSSPIYNTSMKKSGDAMAVSVVDVKYIPAMELATTLNQFLTPSGRIAAYGPSNDLMIADRAGNIVNLMRIIKQIDQPQTTNILVIRLRNAQAKSLVETLKPLIESKSSTGVSSSLKGPTIVADQRSNSLLISGGSKEQRLQMQSIISKLDLPTVSSATLTEVLYLKHLQAERAAIIVNGIIQNYVEKSKQTGEGGSGSSGTSSSSSSSGSNQQGNGRDEVSSLFNQSLTSQSQSSGPSTVYSASSGYFTSNAQNNDISNIVQKTPKSGSVSPAVQWEESTNSLIVTAPRDLMRKIRRVIMRLDIRRPQVLIEAIIAEVSSERQKELGIEWNPGGSVEFQTRFLPLLPLSLIGNNDKLATVAGGPDTVGQGLSLTYGGNHIRFLLRALETDRESNVLATPNLVTLDNEPAQIKVGTKVPFATAQIQNNPSGGNPFNFFNREDVGLVLTINPQIAPNGMIKLLIQQELSAVIPGTASSAGGNPTTSERFIRTTVMADHGRILVLGGLLQNQWNETRNQLPWLGNLPGIGFLFRDRAKTSSKTNLMIFLRPTILYDEKDDSRVSNGKYEYLRQSQLQTGNNNPLKRSYEPPVLPILGKDVSLPSPFQEPKPVLVRVTKTVEVTKPRMRPVQGYKQSHVNRAGEG